MLSRLRKFSRASRREKGLFLEAYLLLGFMRAAILTISFKRLTRSLVQYRQDEQPLTQSQKELLPEQKCVAMEVARAIARAAKYTPWESACLVQVLTARRMLQRRGLPGMFYLGVVKNNDSSAEESMRAHAWSICGDTIITGGKGHEDFAVLSVFVWESK
jgi:hypothetical protein